MHEIIGPTVLNTFVISRSNDKDSAAPVNKLLNAPVQISSLQTEKEEIQQSNSIWLSKRDSNKVGLQ